MKNITNFINENKEIDSLTIEDWGLLGAIIDYLRGDLKHNLEDIRKKEDLKTLYDKISAVYKNLKNK